MSKENIALKAKLKLWSEVYMWYLTGTDGQNVMVKQLFAKKLLIQP